MRQQKIMKLTRRKSILTLVTILILIGIRSRERKVQTKYVKSFQYKEIPITSDIVDALVDNDIDKQQIYAQFLKAAAGGFQDNPALLYQGIQTSPYKEQIKNYPTLLTQKPNEKNLVDGTDSDDTFHPYPVVGQLPEIDEQGLNFLHEDIKEACVCVGSFSSGEFKTKWLGRNARSNQEFWSATKIISVLNLVCCLNTTIPDANFDSYRISGVDHKGVHRSFPIYDLVRDLVSYEEKIASSNSLAGMFRRFSSQLQLENWLKSITGNKDLVFRGDYGEEAFIYQPEVIERNTGKVLMVADTEPPNPDWTNNTLSAYDLTRMISMLGWHNYIPPQSRLPGVKWHNLKGLVKAMGTDPARLTDLAIKVLDIQNTLDSVVILSKIGNGRTSLRKRTESVYVALVQLVIRSSDELGDQAQLLTLGMALRGARALQPRDFNREVVELDARMATEVTEILHRLLNSEWT
jgi:hypothetical protein